MRAPEKLSPKSCTASERMAILFCKYSTYYLIIEDLERSYRIISHPYGGYDDYAYRINTFLLTGKGMFTFTV